ncbi:MAG: hypothetical protein ACK47B_19380 [Armatimonadota bacterium]
MILEEPRGPYHDFWLLREGEVPYAAYWDYLRRRDAPLRIADDVLRYFYDSLEWFPALVQDRKRAPKPIQGLDLYGDTIVNHEGGALFAEVFAAWAQLFRLGPEEIILSAGWVYTRDEDGRRSDEETQKLLVRRDELVRDLELLAEWGRAAATGEFYILHLGI